MATSSKEKPDSRGGREPTGPSPTEHSEAMLRAILDSAVDAIIIIDSSGIVETYNNAARQIFQHSLEEVVGKNVSMLMPEPFAAEHNGYLSNYLKTGQEKVIGIGREAVGRRKDGSIIPIELAVSEVNFDGRRMFTGIVRDITERKRLEKEILDVAEREQQRLGFDLHDGLCQEIAGIAFLVQSAQQKASSGGTVDPSDLAAVTDFLQKALRHARGLSRGLYPVGPQPNGLAVALADLAANTTDVFKINCTFDCPVPVTTHDSVAATHLFRIAQEAVRDAVRHGKAGNVAIEMVKTRDVLRVSINDDGLGINEDGRFREDRTLHMMKYRARIIGAVLRLESREGGGAVVTCELRDHRKLS
jgi:PAS domain S-box-containing protein